MFGSEGSRVMAGENIRAHKLQVQQHQPQGFSILIRTRRQHQALLACTAFVTKQRFVLPVMAIVP